MRPIDFLSRGAERHADAVALAGPDRSLRYGELAAEVDALAAGLQALDPDAGSRVALIGNNCVEHVVALLAILAAGKIWVPFLPANGAAEAQRIVDFVDASIVLGDEAGLALLDGFAGGNHRRMLAAGGAGSTGALRADHAGRAPIEHARNRDTCCAIKFTGGSTGTPKGVMQPDRAWNAFVAMLIHHLGFVPGERTLVATPITHGISTFLLPTLATGGTVVLHERPDPGAMLDAFTAGAARTFAPPTLINRMAADGGAWPERFPGLRQILYSAAPMLPQDIAAAQAAFGPRLVTAYGQTEAPLMITFLDEVGMAHPELRGTVGQDALLSRSAILDPEGAVMPSGEIGEIGVRGDLLMTGYWGRPDLTEAAFANGWLKTGDLGIRGGDGYVTIKGRSREMINTGGFKVFPGDVEAVLRGHAAVADCAVFGRSDAQWGETVCAVVAVNAPVEPAALTAHVRRAMGPVRAPKQLRIVERVPRNAQGKLQRHLLAEEFADG